MWTDIYKIKVLNLDMFIWFCLSLLGKGELLYRCRGIFDTSIALLSLLNRAPYCSALKIPDIWFAWGNLRFNFFFLIIPAVLHPIALAITYRNEWQCAAHSQAVMLVHYKSRFLWRCSLGSSQQDLIFTCELFFSWSQPQLHLCTLEQHF